MLQGGSPAAASPSIVYLLGDDYPWQLWPRAGNAQARALLPRLSETFVKWHAGYVTESYVPWRRGFDSAYGFFASGVDYTTKCSYKAAPPTDTQPLRWCRHIQHRG